LKEKPESRFLKQINNRRKRLLRWGGKFWIKGMGGLRSSREGGGLQFKN